MQDHHGACFPAFTFIHSPFEKVVFADSREAKWCKVKLHIKPCLSELAFVCTWATQWETEAVAAELGGNGLPRGCQLLPVSQGLPLSASYLACDPRFAPAGYPLLEVKVQF